MNRVWKPIPGYESLYIVSNDGEVASLQKWNGRRYVKRNEPYILSKTKTTTGYWKVDIRGKYSAKRKSERVHRLVALAFIDNPNNYPCINHLDCNPLNNRVENLEWCTIKMNNDYAAKYGNRKKKTISSNELRECISNGMKMYEISEKYGIPRKRLARLRMDYGINLQTKYKFDKKWFIAAFEKGMSNREITAIFNCPPGLVARRKYQYKRGEIK